MFLILLRHLRLNLEAFRFECVSMKLWRDSQGLTAAGSVSKAFVDFYSRRILENHAQLKHQYLMKSDQSGRTL
jgi:hypothetical protein